MEVDAGAVVSVFCFPEEDFVYMKIPAPATTTISTTIKNISILSIVNKFYQRENNFYHHTKWHPRL
jgi:hypothetical protein